MNDNQKLKLIKTVSDTIDSFLTVGFVLLFLIGIYFIYDSAYVYYHSTAKRVAAYKPDGTNTQEILRELSEDCIAWISMDDSSLDYPIMQGDSNYEYLNKDAYGDYSLSGAIFLDFRNANDFTDDYSLIYGHHMTGGFMFGCLDEWKNEDYFNSHLNGTLYVGSKTYNYKVFAFASVLATDETIFNPTSYYPLNYIRNHAMYCIEPQGEKIVVLSTCVSATTLERYILAGTIEETTIETVAIERSNR